MKSKPNSTPKLITNKNYKYKFGKLNTSDLNDFIKSCRKDKDFDENKIRKLWKEIIDNKEKDDYWTSTEKELIQKKELWNRFLDEAVTEQFQKDRKQHESEVSELHEKYQELMIEFIRIDEQIAEKDKEALSLRKALAENEKEIDELKEQIDKEDYNCFNCKLKLDKGLKEKIKTLKEKLTRRYGFVPNEDIIDKIFPIESEVKK